MSQTSQRPIDNPNLLGAQIFLLVLAVMLTLGCADHFVPRSILASLPGALLLDDPASESEAQDGGVFYMGDSVVDFFVEGESDERSIARMLEDISKTPTRDLSHGAYGQKMFYAQLRRLIRDKASVDSLVIPVNLRSFSPRWETTPTWDFKETYLSEAYNLYLTQRAYRVLEEKTPTPMRKPTDPKKPKTNTQSECIANYAYDMDQSQSLPYLAANASLTKEAQFSTLFYITPIDWDTIKKHLPESKIEAVESNLSRLRNILRESGVDWVDLSDIAESGLFHYPESKPDEHLNQAGRLRVAQEIEKGLLLKKERGEANLR